MALLTYSRLPATSIYHKHPLELCKTLNRLLVLIPGNPGLVDFYQVYLDLIQRQYPGLEILAISHAGFQSTGNFKEGPHNTFDYGLDYQVQHKIDVIRDFIQNKDFTDLYFLSHSMGCYLTQRIVKIIQEEDEFRNKVRIKFVGFICPTIRDIAASNSGKKFVALSSYKVLPVIKIAKVFSAFITSIFSESLLRRIIRNSFVKRPAFPTEDENLCTSHAVEAMLKIIQSKRLINSALSLAQEEMLSIKLNSKDTDYCYNRLTSHHNVKVWSYFAFGDHWVSDQTKLQLLEKYENTCNQNLIFYVGTSADSPKIEHSFCVHQSTEFAKITVDAMSHAYI